MTGDTRPPAIFLMGPTAAGKTELAMELAQRLPVEIISVDSAMIYRGMDIGTAKPSPKELQTFPHHLVDICDPAERYSVGRFCQDAGKLMERISLAGKIPLLVGGTMMYFRALQYGLAELPDADSEVRKRLEQDVQRYGLAHLHQQLERIDPVSARRIHKTDSQRLQRALEVYEITGQSLSELTADTSTRLQHQVSKVMLAPESRPVLHSRIAKRFENMLEQGFIDEVRTLYQRGDLDTRMPAVRAVGYRQAWSYLSCEYDRATFVERAIIATRQMAKRQITWLRSQQDGAWFDSGKTVPIESVMKMLKGAL